MRWVFFTLLAVNVGVLGYMLWERSADFRQADISSPAIIQDRSGPSIVLLDELAINEQEIASVRIADPKATVGSSRISGGIPSGGSRSLCTLVGSFSSMQKAERFVDRLAALGVQSKIKNLLVSSTVGFWLHLPPQSSRKEVLRRLSELQRQGVDSYVIPDGDLSNGISLGMFSERQRAETLKNNIVRLGYQPEILSVPRERRELWVFLSPEEVLKIDTNRWLKLLSEKELLQKQENLCSDVASS